MKNLIVGLLLCLGLSGCMGNQGLQGMTADQIVAMGKDSNAVCITTSNVLGAVKSVWVNVDQSVIENGGVAVDANCAVTFTNSATPKAGTTTTTIVSTPR